jgi:hypothetical protein
MAKGSFSSRDSQLRNGATTSLRWPIWVSELTWDTSSARTVGAMSLDTSRISAKIRLPLTKSGFIEQMLGMFHVVRHRVRFGVC